MITTRIMFIRMMIVVIFIIVIVARRAAQTQHETHQA